MALNGDSRPETTAPADRLRWDGRRGPFRGPEKVQGTLPYAADREFRGLLHARLVVSPYARARLDRIDASAALAIPEVVAVLTAADFPVVAGHHSRLEEPLASDEVVFAGQPIAIVVATSEAFAEDGASQVLVDMEPLEVVADVQRALGPDAPAVRTDRPASSSKDVLTAHGGAFRGNEASTGTLPANVLHRVREARGDGEAIDRAEVVLRRRYEAGWVYQAYLEPQVAVAVPVGQDGLEVVSSTQGIFETRAELARIFGLDPAHVRVVGAPIGGSFGGKVLIAEPLAAGAALKLHRPVRLVLTRSEDFAATSPMGAFMIDATIGAKRTGELVGIRARVTVDYGAYDNWGLVNDVALDMAGGYRWSAYDIEVVAVSTNRFGCGAYRGPGGPQTAFALETMLDDLAVQLRVSPAELRLQNLARPGEPQVDGRPWEIHGMREVLERVARHPLWQGRDKLPVDEGIGFAAACWHGGLAKAAALCQFERDGRFSVVIGAPDMSGANGSFALIAAATLGVDPSMVRVIEGDTANAPWAETSAGSKAVYTIGEAIRLAMLDLRGQMLRAAAGILHVSEHELAIEGTGICSGDHLAELSFVQLAHRLDQPAGPIMVAHGTSAQRRGAPMAAAHLVHVRVNRETGDVTPLQYVVAQDVGHAIDLQRIEGQIRGSVTQGLGMALSEELLHDENGQLVTGSFLDYPVPRTPDAVPVEISIVEQPAPDGPFGARGAGEASIIPVAAAVGNAIAAATGARLTRMPMTRPRVWAALTASDDDQPSASRSVGDGS
jgi:CO/xanthine dehydrogenase Mo-binding subunit